MKNDLVAKKSEKKMLFFDIETMPNLVRTWRKWEQNVIWYERYGYLWSLSWSYDDRKKVYHKNITDFPLYKKDKYSDKALVEFIWRLVDNNGEGIIRVAHNGVAFDMKAIYGRFIHYRMKPPTPGKDIDTLRLYRKHLNEDSNSLKDIAVKHNLTYKVETNGFTLWRKCEDGVKSAINKMKFYNNGDVITLREAYLLVLPYITNHPNMGLMNGDKVACPNCGSLNVQKRGFNLSRVSKSQRWQCRSCGSWHSSPLKNGSQLR